MSEPKDEKPKVKKFSIPKATASELQRRQDEKTLEENLKNLSRERDVTLDREHKRILDKWKPELDPVKEIQKVFEREYKDMKLQLELLKDDYDHYTKRIANRRKKDRDSVGSETTGRSDTLWELREDAYIAQSLLHKPNRLRYEEEYKKSFDPELGGRHSPNQKLFKAVLMEPGLTKENPNARREKYERKERAVKEKKIDVDDRESFDINQLKDIRKTVEKLKVIYQKIEKEAKPYLDIKEKIDREIRDMEKRVIADFKEREVELREGKKLRIDKP